MILPKHTDALIIGGGPAGAMAATMLAKQGIDVVLLEKARFPRYAVGESLIPHFWKFMDQMGTTAQIEQEGFIQKSGGAAYWNGVLKAMYFGEHGHKRPGLHVERERFDQILLERAKEMGAIVAEEVTVKKVKTDDAGALIAYHDQLNDQKGSISARFVIDCSGQSAVLAKQFGFREFDENFRFQAFWGYFDQSDYLNGEGELTSFDQRFSVHPMSLAVGMEDWGWVWHLVLKDKVSVGAMIPKSRLAAFKVGGAGLEERFVNHIQTTPLTSRLLQNAKLASPVRTMRDYAYHPKKLAFDNCFLAGDAAAFADPINSEGVTISLYGGLMAAWAVEKSLHKQQRSDFYRELYCDSLRKRLQVFQLLSYPKKQIPAHLIESCKNIIANQSPEETSLILGHLMITNRAEDFPELVQSLGIPIKEAWREITLSK